MHNQELRAELLLDKLRSELIMMGAKTRKAIDNACFALSENDHEKAQGVLQGDNEIDNLENLIDSASLNLLIRTQPVARDLRFIMTAIRMVQDLERIGDEAVSIAKRTLLAQGLLIAPVREDFNIFIELAKSKLALSLEAFNNQDTKLALNIIRKRYESADLSIIIFQKIIDALQNQEIDATSSMHLILICRALDRITRRTENIAEHTYFMVEGVSLKHQTGMV